jgi:hypothetical protein
LKISKNELLDALVLLYCRIYFRWIHVTLFPVQDPLLDISFVKKEKLIWWGQALSLLMVDVEEDDRYAPIFI